MATSRKAPEALTPALDLWRISNYETLNGEGGLSYPGRWHSVGRPVVYLAASGPGALLETLVHLKLDAEDLPPSYKLMRVAVPAGKHFVELAAGMGAWQKDMHHTQALGDTWLASKSSALAKVPSAIMPHATNWLLNPKHPQARSIRIAEVLTVEYDERLLRARLAAQM